MGLKVTVFGSLRAVVWDRQSMRQLARAAVGQIQQRAFDLGRGLDDQPHRAYSPGYAKIRRARGEQVTPPNLTVTGRMRRALRSPGSVRADRALIGLTGRPAVYGHFVHKARPWLGSSPKDRVVLEKAALAIARATLKRTRRAPR